MSQQDCLEKFLDPEWYPKSLITSVSGFLLILRDDPTLMCYAEYSHPCGNYGLDEDIEDGLNELIETMEYYARRSGSYCHAVKAREHILKDFLFYTEGVQVEDSEQMAKIVKAREEAQDELAYYDRVFYRLIRPLVDVFSWLPAILMQDLPGLLTQENRETFDRYDELYTSRSKIEVEDWEQLPIVEFLGIAKECLVAKKRKRLRLQQCLQQWCLDMNKRRMGHME